MKYFFGLSFVLFLIFLIPLNASAESVTVLPTDDAYAVADLHYEDDPAQLRTLNTGNLEYLKVWYSWDVTSAENQIVSPGYLKFNLPDFKTDALNSAILRIHASQIDATSDIAPVAVFDLAHTNWSESTLTYDLSPQLTTLRGLLPIDAPNWYVIDVTNMVKENPNSTLDMGIFYAQLVPNTEQSVIISSKESQNGPQLILDIQPSDEITIEDALKIPEKPSTEITQVENDEETTEEGGCLIATAAFGSEMAPQVQLLREIRDNTVLNTQSGTAFMASFNQFYYSFSPYVADYERENPLFKEAVKLGITPMLSSLSILSVVDIDSEEEMLGFGIGVILINIGMYLVAPAMSLVGIKKLRSKI